jgi:hypothetical protein
MSKSLPAPKTLVENLLFARISKILHLPKAKPRDVLFYWRMLPASITTGPQLCNHITFVAVL